jgi:hypothetical protein
LRTSMFFISSKTLFPHRVLGVPICLLDMVSVFQSSAQYYPQPCVLHGLTNLVFVFLISSIMFSPFSISLAGPSSRAV